MKRNTKHMILDEAKVEKKFNFSLSGWMVMVNQLVDYSKIVA